MFQIDFASRIPIYEQICTNIIKLASAGVLKPGDRIPAVRTLATQLGINPNTVAKSFRELENRGYIYSVVGRGSYITEALSENSAAKLLAVDEFKGACENALNFGVNKEELIKIIEDTFEGGENID
ncbi:MAG: GntR family transcriptional regulator [Ruminococcus bromii]|nr:GntR family transcriptional regulator [Ruminococcus bromii]